MHINLNQFYKPFIAWMNDMVEEYGEEFQKLNGLHNENLNFTGFIDHFIDNSTVADSTIDSNANNSTKDVRTLMSDMMKPHTKLLALNKIFYEISKNMDFKLQEIGQQQNGMVVYIYMMLQLQVIYHIVSHMI